MSSTRSLPSRPCSQPFKGKSYCRFATGGVPIIHDLNHLLLSTDTIVNEVRFAQEPSHVRSFPIRRSQFGKIGEQFGTIDEVVAEAFRSRRIVLRDETNNLLQLFERLRCEKLFSSPSTD